MMLLFRLFCFLQVLFYTFYTLIIVVLQVLFHNKMAQKGDEDNGHSILADNFTENLSNDLSRPITETG